jgi:hypothetical protein
MSKSKSFFTRQVRTSLLTAMVAIVAVFSKGVFAQYAAVPFLVNVDATVKAEIWRKCLRHVEEQISVTANQVDTMRLYLGDCLGVRYSAQRQTSVPAIVSNLGGKVTVNLPTQSYKNAEISLYTVTGKRILRNNVSVSSAVNSVSRPNIAMGIYLLTVKGVDGNVITSRLTHSGGGLNINVAFGNGSENRSVVSQMSKKTYDELGENWTITVSTTIAGYEDIVYGLHVVAGVNALQNITLREKPSVDDDGSYEPVVIVNKR